MNFKEEYKNSIEIMGPSAEQLERMKKNIMEQAKAPEKKAIPFKKIAYIGGAVAACAVISVAAINIIPRLSDSSNLTAAESYNAVGGNGFEDGAYENAAMDAAADYAPEYVTEDKSVSDDPCGELIFNGAEPSFDPMVDYDYSDESDTAADDVCCDDATVNDVATEMTDTPTSAPVTTTAVNAGSSTDTPTEDEPASADKVQDAVQDIETEPSIYIADDLSYIDIGSEFFVGLGNEAELPEKVVDLPVTNISYTSPDGAEYRLEFHSEGIIVLFRGDEVIGMYARLTLD